METMKDFITQVKDRYGITSDNQLALTLGLSRQAISQHKHGRAKHFSDDTAYKIAQLLGLNPSYVLLCLAVERSKSKPTKAVWRGLIEKVQKYAAAVLVALGVSWFALFSPTAPQVQGNVYYVKFRRRQLSLC